MPVCEKCKNKFPSTMVIDGVRKILNRRKYCLSCSPYKEHNTRRLKFFDLDVSIGNKQCLKCKLEKPATEFYPRTKDGFGTYSYCIQCWKNLSTKRQQDTKEWCVRYKGGKCERCGYDKYPEALDFHHRDRNTKKFNISQAKSLSKENLQLELDKCDLFCCRCHREVEIELR